MIEAVCAHCHKRITLQRDEFEFFFHKFNFDFFFFDDESCNTLSLDGDENQFFLSKLHHNR
jgi:hypothetical protein